MKRESLNLAPVAGTLIVGAMMLNGVTVCAAKASQASVDSDGVVHVPAFDIPFSIFASDDAKKAFIESTRENEKVLATDMTSTPEGLKQFILKWRKKADEARKEIVQEMLGTFPVTVAAELIGGVQTDVVTPKAGISPRNQNRVLINLHGGGMIFGARYEGQVMSIPIASVGKIKVITVDFRMAPEYRFPAASEDVAAVYAALLKTYKPENIGIYGCSAGGWLTAQSVAWFQAHDLPRPGAVGIMGGGAGPIFGGDSSYVASALSGIAPPKKGKAASKNPHLEAVTLYTSEANPSDSMVFPLNSVEVLAKFPPTLFLNSTRDGLMSAAIHSHLQFVKAGVDAELYLWDGMGHCFMYDPKLPESQEAYEVTVKFFEKHLGQK